VRKRRMPALDKRFTCGRAVSAAAANHGMR
jgi:hypothetical protein